MIRHAETDLAGKFCGHTDPELNAAGKRRLTSIAEEVATLGISRIYSSDLRRASQTAEEVGRQIGVEVELRPGLREINFGLWEGLSWEEIQDRYPRESELWLKAFPLRSAPEGEAYADFVARIDAEFHLLFAESGDSVYAIVTHRGVMQYVLTHFFGVTRSEAWKRTAPYGVVVIESRARISDYRNQQRATTSAYDHAE